MRLCSRCVLPDTFPGIRFDVDGLCNYCLAYKDRGNQANKKLEYRRKFEELIREYGNKGSHDALMSYSGGKDSTYALSLLKKTYGLNVLALTFDNGFLAEQTFSNIRSVVEQLGVDHIIFKPRYDLLKKIFAGCSKKDVFQPTTLTRASTICTACMALVKFYNLRLALEKRIPFIVFGWSPGQIPLASSIMKNLPQMVRSMQETVLMPLRQLAGEDIKQYFLNELHFEDPKIFPYNISPLAFVEYNEKKILQEANRLGWRIPRDVDSNSTNCLLNSFANVIHKNRHGFHPYAFELAKLVREGNMDRAEAISRLDQVENPETVDSVKNKLGI